MYSEKEQAEQKLCRRYCRELRRVLACVPELRERTLAQLTESIEEYLDEHPTAEYQELVRVFGTPAQAAENVLNEMDAKQVQQILKKISVAQGAGNRSGRSSYCLRNLSDCVWRSLSVQSLHCRIFLLGKLCG